MLFVPLDLFLGVHGPVRPLLPRGHLAGGSSPVNWRADAACVPTDVVARKRSGEKLRCLQVGATRRATRCDTRPIGGFEEA